MLGRDKTEFYQMGHHRSIDASTVMKHVFKCIRYESRFVWLRMRTTISVSRTLLYEVDYFVQCFMTFQPTQQC